MLRILFALFTSTERPIPRPAPGARDGEDGFTLVELMVVIVIIGLLATVVLVNVLPSQDRAMVTKARADIATLDQAMEMYRLDNFTYPTDLNALVAPAAGSAPGQFRSGGYIKKLPSDPWQRPYQLTVPGKSGPYEISSLGSDGVPGGTDDKADISSSQE